MPITTKPAVKQLTSPSDLSFPKKFLKIKERKPELDFMITKMMVSDVMVMEMETVMAEMAMEMAIPTTPTTEAEMMVLATETTKTKIEWTSTRTLPTLLFPTETSSTS